MKRLLTGCVTALTLLSATPVGANHIPPQQLEGTCHCYMLRSIYPEPSEIGTIQLDGQSNYSS